MTSRLWILLILVAALPIAASAQTQTSNETGSAADTTSSKTEEAPAKESPAPQASAQVARAVFATDVAEHEPVDELEAIPADLDQLYYFTEIVDMEGEVITHEWSVDGEVVAEVPIEVGGPRWRVHSTKTLPTGAPGTWTVRVLDDTGAVLHESEIAGEAEPASVTG